MQAQGEVVIALANRHHRKSGLSLAGIIQPEAILR